METEIAVCANCGDRFEKSITDSHRKLCNNPLCKVEWQRKLTLDNARRRGKPLDEYVCAVCGTLFTPKTIRSRCCSPECIYENNLRKNRERYRASAKFREKAIERAKKYQAEHSEELAKKSVDRVRRWRKKNKRKYQAQHNEQRFNGNWLKVMDRDEWICRICGSDAKVIHHIDKDKQNNSLKNLTALCRKCHINIHRSDLNNKGWVEG